MRKRRKLLEAIFIPIYFIIGAIMLCSIPNPKLFLILLCIEGIWAIVFTRIWCRMYELEDKQNESLSNGSPDVRDKMNQRIISKNKLKSIWDVIQEQAFIAGTDALCDGESFKPKDVDKFIEIVDKMIDDIDS